jgi:PKD repeat protein
MWIKAKYYPYHIILSKYDSYQYGPGGQSILIRDGKLEFFIADTLDRRLVAQTSSAVIEDENWHHLAFVFDGSQTNYSYKMKIYLDGVEQDLYYPYTYAHSLIPDVSPPWRIGTTRHSDGQRYYFDGFIDEVRVYNRALSAEEIWNIYEAEKPVVNNPPAASFTYSPTSPTTDDTVQFTDQSTDPDGTIVSWSWDFGDGATSTEQNPTHQYLNAGTYTVTLTVTDNGGATDTASQSITVSTPEKIPTTISISPPSFTIQSGEPITLTATLRDNAGNSLADKTISWAVSSGSDNVWTLPVALESTTTGSTGQTSITYTAPEVTVEIQVKITASFAGGNRYSGSHGTSTGTVTPTTLAPTSILISPLVFDVKSQDIVKLTVLLTGEGGVPLAGKLITLTTTQGAVSPTSGTTDNLGTLTATFTAPRVDVRTFFILSATFAGDNEHSPSYAYSTGTVRSAALAETVEKIEQSIEQIEVKVEELQTTVEVLVEKLENAIVENRIAICVSIENCQPPGPEQYGYRHAEVEAEIEVRGTNIEVRVDSKENHKTILVNIDDYTKKVLQLDRIGVWVDNVQIDQADDYDDVLDPTDDGDEPEYLVLAGRNGVQVFVSIPRFSTRTITIATLPTVPTVEAPPPYILIVAALVLVAVLVAIIWRYLWVGARKLPKAPPRAKAPPERRLDRELLGYIAEHGGEISILEASKELGVSQNEVRRALERLKRAGKVAEE